MYAQIFRSYFQIFNIISQIIFCRKNHTLQLLNPGKTTFAILAYKCGVISYIIKINKKEIH